ncbi:transporter [Ganoderma sinense ZZ0214-1]|uniref:Transporter n=1 Tax=Ganoderma sinense ZZ0214-1 TaxID=1077348 RepID=A0A2G8SNY5_9APHY|nr:transporter [Ganoderma sinense ZZ0214-1]
MAFNNPNPANPLFGGGKPAGQTGGLFGQSTTQPAGALFGATQQQPQQQGTTSAFGGFGQPATQNQPAQGTLFGSTTQTAGAGTGLFGSTTQNTGTTGTNLFGQNTQQQGQQQQPAQGTSFFGGGAFGQPQQQQQQQPATGLFGQSTTQQPAGGLFGQQQPQQPQPAGGFFGAANQQQQKLLFGGTTGSTMFGSTAQTQPTQQSTLGGFGSTFQPQATQPNLFGSTAGTQAGGSGLWGKPAMQQPAQPTGTPLFTKSTKFNDLSDEVKKGLEALDAQFQSRIQICNDLKQRKLGEEPLKGQEEIRSVQKVLAGAISVLGSDVQHTRDLKLKAEQTVQDTIVATRIIEGFRNPQQHGQYLKTHANFPLEFFTRVTEQIRERLRWYKATIEVGFEFLRSNGQVYAERTAIVSTLEAQHATFMALATKAAALDSELQKIKKLYTQLWREKVGSMRDPFNDIDRGVDSEYGLESLTGK